MTGTDVADPSKPPYFRSGPYQVLGPNLSTPALNDGSPVGLGRSDGRLFLKVDEGLTFRLERAPPAGSAAAP